MLTCLKHKLKKKVGHKLTDEEILMVINDVIEEVQESKTIPLLNQQNEIEWIHIQEIYTVESTKKNVVFTTQKGTYHQLNDKTSLSKFLLDHNFALTDRSQMVNISLVKKYDSYMGRVYFEDHITPETPYAQVSMRVFDLLKKQKHLGKENDIADEMFQHGNQYKKIMSTLSNCR